ncbi:MAG: hypothetical protein HY326_12775 [Chloroflexi bacterium]|nr:hypothetical protein [Chloroflexota bacterium]
MKVLVATKSLEVFHALQGRNDVQIEEALFSGQVYDGLAGARLVVIDFDDLVPHPHSIEMLREVLADSGTLSVSSEEFLAQPDRWLADAMRATGEMTTLPDKMAIAIVSYSGGTGRTTLAIDTALHFARRTRLPVLLTEFTYGVSSISALTGLTMPHLFDLTTQVDAIPSKWKGVTLAPMDYENCQDLPLTLLSKFMHDQMGHHVLTVVDAQWPHALLGSIRDQIDRWLVIANPRPDSIENARKLKEELGQNASIVLNQVGGASDTLALQGVERDLVLSNIQNVDRFEGQIGKKILSLTYGTANWRRYEPKNAFARLGRRLGLSRNSA